MVSICQQKKNCFPGNKNVDEIKKYIGSDSLNFLSIEGLYKALVKEKRNNNYPQFSDHYFTGEYPIKPLDNLEMRKLLNYLC